MSTFFYQPQPQHQHPHAHQHQHQHQHQHAQPPPPHHQHQHQHHLAHHHMANPASHHAARSRRGPKATPGAQRQFRGVKSMRELAEAPAVTAFRTRFEAGRSFDLDDDVEFCPDLLTEDDLRSIHSASSDRSSLSSGSPESSPLQHQIQPVQPVQQVTPSISLSPALTSSSYVTATSSHSSAAALQQASAAARTRKVIPIVNPHTGMTLSSPPTSIVSNTMAAQRW